MPVYDDEKTEAQRLRDITGIGADEEGAMDREAHNGAAEDIADREGLSGSGDGKKASGKELDKSEKKPADGFKFDPEDSSLGNRAKLAKFFGSRKGRGLLAGGGIAGVVIGGGLGIFSLISGPAEFIQIAHLLEQFHFSSQQDASDDRFSKLMRYLRDPSNPQRTRLGTLGNHFADKFEAKMNASGIESTYTHTFGFYDGYTVDPNNENIKKIGNEAEIKQYFKDNYNVDLETKDLNGHKVLAVSAFNEGYFKQRGLVKSQLQEAGYSKITAAIAARIMGQRAGIDWHPIRRLDNKIKQSLADKAKEWRENRATDVDKGAAAAAVAREENPGTESDGTVDPAQQANADQAATDTDNVNTEGTTTGQQVASGDPNAIGDLKTKLGEGTGKAGNLVGLACMAEGLNANINEIRQVEVVEPLIREGMMLVTEGNQLESGSSDIDNDQLGFEAAQLNGKDSNGNETSWSQARSIQGELGEPQTGPDISDSAKVFEKGTPFSFLGKIKGLPTVCKAVNSKAGFALQFGISFLGGPISATIQTALAAAIGPVVMNTMAHWLSGNPVDPFPVGADYGNNANYGAKLAANDQALAAGGTALSTADVAALDQTENAQANQDFKSESLAYRLFNVDDSRTLAGKFIDSQSPSVTQNMATLTQGFLHIGSMLASLPQNLFTMHASAAATPYNYGFPTYGFSKADLNNPAVENPYKNAINAANLLDGPNGTSLISKAQDCFGVTISNASGTWDVTGGNSTTQAYNDEYKSKDCGDSSADWLSIRFFIFDTETMESAACYEGDDASCQNVGMGDTSVADTSADVSTIDQSTLYDDSTSIQCANGTKDLGVADGYHDGQKVPIRLCAVSNIPSSGHASKPGDKYYVAGAGGYAIVNSRVSANFYQMAAAAQTGHVNLTADSSYRTYAEQQSLCPCDGTSVAKPGYSNHQMGLAIDFSVPNTKGTSSSSCTGRGEDKGNPMWDWLNDHAASYGIRQYTYEAWHWDALNDATRCGGDGST